VPLVRPSRSVRAVIHGTEGVSVANAILCLGRGRRQPDRAGEPALAVVKLIAEKGRRATQRPSVSRAPLEELRRGGRHRDRALLEHSTLRYRHAYRARWYSLQVARPVRSAASAAASSFAWLLIAKTWGFFKTRSRIAVSSVAAPNDR
jgi:hypothetical protein